MLSAVFRFIRLPILLIVIWAIGRFSMGLFGVPYTPRSNATFSLVVLTLITSLYYGALSKSVGNFSWLGTAMVGGAIGFVAQIFIFVATIVSLVGGLDTYFVNWDAINVPEGTAVTMSNALPARASGLVINMLLAAAEACIGRLLAGLAPKPVTQS
ncbi:MAG: hypothetical protein ACREOI_15900 [bacterium]